jgi:hypothetical protein
MIQPPLDIHFMSIGRSKGVGAVGTLAEGHFMYSLALDREVTHHITAGQVSDFFVNSPKCI